MKHALSTFLINLLICIYQKKKIAPEITAKIASVDGPIHNSCFNRTGTITRVEFSATAKQNYFLVIGRPDTLIPEGQTFTIFGRLPNGRWRCSMDREDRQGSSNCNDTQDINSYPLIGSVPTSVIVELNQPSSIKDYVDSLSISSNETSPPGTPTDDLSTTSSNSFNYDDIPSSQSPRRSSDAVVPGSQSPRRSSDAVVPSSQPPRRSSDAVIYSSQASRSEPYSNHKYGNTLTPARGSFSTSEQTPPPNRPTQINPSGNQVFTHRVTRPSNSSISPTSPRPESVSNAITDLNRALESLNALSTLKPRARVSSDVSTCSKTSNSSQEDESSDMSRGSRIQMDSDDEATADSNAKSGESCSLGEGRFSLRKISMGSDRIGTKLNPRMGSIYIWVQ